MPRPVTAIAGAAIVAALGYGVGHVVLDSGGSSTATAARPPTLSADPTGRPAHDSVRYAPPPGTQQVLPGAAPAGGQAPAVGAGPAEGPGYVAHGQPRAGLRGLPSAPQPGAGTTWPLYLSGSDQLNGDLGGVVMTDQSIGSNPAGACGAGQAGKWTIPPPQALPLHGTLPGRLTVSSAGPVTLQIAFTSSALGGSCTVLSSTSAYAPGGTSAVSFTLPRVDADLPSGVNVSLVVSSSGSARVVASAGSPSYVVAPTAPQ